MVAGLGVFAFTCLGAWLARRVSCLPLWRLSRSVLGVLLALAIILTGLAQKYGGGTNGMDRAGAPRRMMVLGAGGDEESAGDGSGESIDGDRIDGATSVVDSPIRFTGIRLTGNTVELDVGWDPLRLDGGMLFDVFSRATLSTGVWSCVASAQTVAGDTNAHLSVSRFDLPGGSNHVHFFALRSGTDSDLDGLSDEEERTLGLNSQSRDSDSDGFVDGSDPDYDPFNPTPLADNDHNGLPDAYEVYAFGATGLVGDARLRDATGFSPRARFLAGMNPSATQPSALTEVIPGVLVSWKLWDGFSANWSAETDAVVFERTLPIGRQGPWQQVFLSSSPDAATPWQLEGMRVEWNGFTVDGEGNPVTASPTLDCYHVENLPAECPNLTVRLRATANFVRCRRPVYLHVFTPVFRVEGATVVELPDGPRVSVVTADALDDLRFTIDDSMRLPRYSPNDEECDCRVFPGDSVRGLPAFSFESLNDRSPVGWLGRLTIPGPGVYTSPHAPGPGDVQGGSGNASTGASRAHDLLVLSPELVWHEDGNVRPLVVDSATGFYAEEDRFPLDPDCLHRTWTHDATGAWPCLCKADLLLADMPVSVVPAYVETSLRVEEGFVRGSVRVGGEEVWTGSDRHFCAADGREPSRDETDPFSDACGSCSGGCADGDCDKLEGPSLSPDGSKFRFRIPGGSPRKGSVDSFLHCTLSAPAPFGDGSLALLAHADSQVVDGTLADGTRAVVGSGPRGRTVTLAAADGALTAIVHTTDHLTPTGRLEHTWRLVPTTAGGLPAVRVTKTSRRANVMRDETFVHDAASGAWSRVDNVSGLRETVARSGSYDVAEGEATAVRNFADGAGNVLRTETVVTRRIGSGRRAVAREVRRVENDGGRVRTRCADYWDDPATGRHGKVRLVRGDSIPWEYRDYDAEGREILRVEQRNGLPVPDAFPVPAADGTSAIDDPSFFSLPDAFVTIFAYEPLAGDASHDGDRLKPRSETRFAVSEDAAACIGRSWFRYTHPLASGVPALKRETWRAGAPDAARHDDVRNAYSYETVYDETADGVPHVLRGETAESLDEDGIRTTVSLTVADDALELAERRAKETHAFPTYEVRTLDALRGSVLRRETRLTDGDTVIDFEQSLYDEKDRLRSTTYSDGTVATNDYSCCRLLSTTDRAGRTTLRSARTGSDHLYHAMEETWLAEISQDGGHRVTQHFFDALGRETNTVVYAASEAGLAVDASAAEGREAASSRTVYPSAASDLTVRIDARGVATVAHAAGDQTADEEWEEVRLDGTCVRRTETRRVRTGETVRTVRLDDDSWTEERHFSEYLDDGRRRECVTVWTSDDDPDEDEPVTRSATTYDWLGRAVATTVPGPPGWADVTTTVYRYNPDGIRTETWWARGAAGRIVNYDNLGRVESVWYDDMWTTPEVRVSYTDAGLPEWVDIYGRDSDGYMYSYDDRLLCTREDFCTADWDEFALARTHDDHRRGLGMHVEFGTADYAALMRAYDVENRIAGYALTNAAGHTVSVAFAYDGSRATGTTWTVEGATPLSLTLALTRDAGRPELVTRRAYAFDGSPVYWHETDYDLLGRPTDARDSRSFVRSWLYNRRSELASATYTPASGSPTAYGYTYDTIGNRVTATENSTTLTYAANSLNQYTRINRTIEQSEQSNNPSYDADGNLTSDGRFDYAYDDENRLVSASPATPAANDLAVENSYDHLHRRIRKVVYKYVNDEWTEHATHTFVWDGMNIVLERIVYANNTTRTYEYYWGPDRSGTEQGAGGVGGLLAVSIDGTFYFPLYGDNSNIVGYVSETGTLAAQYTYDPYGNVVDSYGNQANLFPFGFSTKYYDRETGFVAYQRRFYSPILGRWLNRDPIEEERAESADLFCRNSPTLYIDVNGEYVFLVPIVSTAAQEMAREVTINLVRYALTAIATALLDEMAKKLVKQQISEQRNCKVCKPCDPSVGTIMYVVHDEGRAHHGMPQHVHYYLVSQSPYPQCKCWAQRDFVNPSPGTEPLRGIPWRLVLGGGVQ